MADPNNTPITNDFVTIQATVEDIQQLFSDNFPIKSTVVMFSDEDNPWQSTEAKFMTYRCIAINTISLKKWIRYRDDVEASDPTSWSSLTSDVTANLIGGSGIDITAGTNGVGIVELNGDITKDVNLVGTDNNAYDFKISGIKDYSVTSNNSSILQVGSTDYTKLDLTSTTFNLFKSNSTNTSQAGVKSNSDIHAELYSTDSTNTMSVNVSTTTSDASLELNGNFDGDVESIKFSSSGMVVTSAAGGLSYDDNYENLNTNNPRWLVDKNYVDTAIGDVTLNNGSGTEYDSNAKAVDLGGSLSKNANIVGNDHQFSVTGASAITLSANDIKTRLVLDSTLKEAMLRGENGVGLESTSGNITLDAHGTVSISSSTATFEMNGVHTFTDSAGNGIKYGGDYESNFAARTLVTKQYVDSVASGLNIKDPVEVVNVNNFDIATGGLTPIDGITIVADMRILLAGQTDEKENGIYLAKSGSWVRAQDANEGQEITDGSYVFVKQGNTYADTGWVQTNPISAVGTSNQKWVLFNRAGFVSGGQGIDVNGNKVKVDLASNSGLAFTSTQDEGKLTIDLEPSTTSGLRTTANGLEIALHNYNAYDDVLIQTTDNDILFVDEHIPDNTAYVGITASDSTNVDPSAQGVVGLGTKNTIDAANEIVSNMFIHRDTNTIELFRSDSSANTNKYLTIEQGNISFGIKDTNANSDKVKIDGTTTGNLTLTASNTFDIGFGAKATITDNRTGNARAGLEYAADYSDGFTAYSLITKGYMEQYVMDNATVDAGSGLTKEASTSGIDTIHLGGNLTRTESINVTDYDFIVNGKTEINGVYTTSLKVNSNDEILLTGGQNELKVTSGGSGIEIKGENVQSGAGASTIDVEWDSIKVTGTSVGFKGIEYTTDYSENFSNYSLITKDFMEKYVDTNATIIAGNGLTKTPSTSGADTVDLGGTLTSETALTGDSTKPNFSISNVSNATFSATSDLVIKTTDGTNESSISINQTNGSVITEGKSQVELKVNAGDYLTINSTDTIFTDSASSTSGADGIKYAGDYMALTDLSLIHKAHLDREITTINDTIGSLTAGDISYDNSGTSGNELNSTNVQDAIDELNSNLINIEVENGLTNTNGKISWGGKLDYASTEIKRTNPSSVGETGITTMTFTDRTSTKDVQFEIDSQLSNVESKLTVNTDNITLKRNDTTVGSIKESYIDINSTGVKLYSQNVGEIEISNNEFTITDNRTGNEQKGIQYADNYRDHFSDLSLVDKKFVTDYVTNNATVEAGSGLSKTVSTTGPDTIDLGGELNKTADILLNNNTFSISYGTAGGAAPESLISYDGNSFTMKSGGSTVTSYITTDSNGSLNIFSDSYTIKSNGGTTTGKGMQYAESYSAANASNARWIPDKGYVDSTVSGSTRTAGAGLKDNTTTPRNLDVNTGDGIQINTTDNTVEAKVGQSSQTTKVINLSIDSSKNIALDKTELLSGTNKLATSTNTATVFLATGTVNSNTELGVAHEDLTSDLSGATTTTTFAGLSTDNNNNLGVAQSDLVTVLTSGTKSGTLIKLKDDGTDVGVDKLDLVTNLSSNATSNTFLALDDDGSDLGINLNSLVTILSSGTSGSSSFVELQDQGGVLGVDAQEIADEIDAQDNNLAYGSIWIGNNSNKSSQLDVKTDAGIIIGNSNTAAVHTLSGDVTMSNVGVVSITDGAVDSDAIAENAVGTSELDTANIPISSFATATDNIDMGGYIINNVGTPVAATDAVNKEYVDTVSAGLRAKASVRYITDNTIGDFTSKSSVAAALDEVDGQDLDDTDIVDGVRILVIWQGGHFNTGHVDNGIYVWDDSANNGNGALVRADDFDGSPDGEVQLGDFTYVAFGDDGGNAQWVLVGPQNGSGTNGGINVGTDALQFSPLAGPSIVNAGAGLMKEGDILQIDLAASGGLEFNMASTSGALLYPKDAQLKVQVDNATAVTGGFASVVNIGSNGLNIGVDDATITQNGSNQLIVKNGGIGTTQLADDAVNITKLDLGEGTNEINATSFDLTSGFGTSGNGTGEISGGDSIQDAIQALDNYVSGLSDVTAQTGSGITVQNDGVVDWNGALTKHANITGNTAAYSVSLGGDGSTAQRIAKFSVYTGNDTIGSSLSVEDDIMATAYGTAGVSGAIVDISSTDNMEISSDDGLTIKGKVPVVTDTSDNGGIVYDKDYSGHYTNRSLVDKEYVDYEISTHVKIVEENVFNPYIDGASTQGAGTLDNTMIIKITATTDYTFAYDPEEDISFYVNGIMEERGNAWYVVDPDNSYSTVPEGSEDAGHAIKWNNDIYPLESDDVITVRYIRYNTTSGTNG